MKKNQAIKQILLTAVAVMVVLATSCHRPETEETDYRNKWCGDWEFTTCYYYEEWNTNPYDTATVLSRLYDTLTWVGNITKTKSDMIKVQFRPIDCSVQIAFQNGFGGLNAGYIEIDAIDTGSDTLQYHSHVPGEAAAGMTVNINPSEAYLGWGVTFGHSGMESNKVYGTKVK